MLILNVKLGSLKKKKKKGTPCRAPHLGKGGAARKQELILNLTGQDFKVAREAKLRLLTPWDDTQCRETSDYVYHKVILFLPQLYQPYFTALNSRASQSTGFAGALLLRL